MFAADAKDVVGEEDGEDDGYVFGVEGGLGRQELGVGGKAEEQSDQTKIHFTSF